MTCIQPLYILGLTKEFFAKQDKAAQEQSNLDEGHFWEQRAMAALELIESAIATPERMKKGLEFTEAYRLCLHVEQNARKGIFQPRVNGFTIHRPAVASAWERDQEPY